MAAAHASQQSAGLLQALPYVSLCRCLGSRVFSSRLSISSLVASGNSLCSTIYPEAEMSSATGSA